MHFLVPHENMIILKVNSPSFVLHDFCDIMRLHPEGIPSY